jgi:hypothetical protein
MFGIVECAAIFLKYNHREKRVRDIVCPVEYLVFLFERYPLFLLVVGLPISYETQSIQQYNPSTL